MTVLDLHDARTEQIPVYQPLRRHRRSRARRVLRGLAILAALALLGFLAGWSWGFGSWLAMTHG